MRDDPCSAGAQESVISVPQFPVLDVVEEIETDLGIPAIPHLALEVWVALGSMGINAPVKGFGKLLQSL